MLVEVTASTQAALFLTEVVVEITGRGVSIRKSGDGLWILSGLVPAKDWTPGKKARLADLCRRLSRHFFEPQPPSVTDTPVKLPDKTSKGEKRFFRPFQATNRFLVVPHNQKPAPESPGETIFLDQAGADGNGIHPATRCCLRLLESATGNGLRIPKALDAGTGTGILAVAAARLGVERVLAIDTDPHAVGAARENVLLNDLKGRIKVRRKDLSEEGGRYPLVTAHLPKKTLLRNGSVLVHCVTPGGLLILGGIRSRMSDTVLKPFDAMFDRVGEDREAWWEAVLLRKKDG